MTEKTTVKTIDLKGIFLAMAENMAAKDPSQIRFECDKNHRSIGSITLENHVIKLNEKPLGGSIEDYAYIAGKLGNPRAVCSVLSDIVLPLRDISPDAYAAGLDTMKRLAPVFRKSSDDDFTQEEWAETIKDLLPEPLPNNHLKIVFH